MRILLDSNVYLSFLLNPFGTGAPQACVAHALARQSPCIVSKTILEEVRRNVLDKPYLRSRIASDQLDSLLDQIERNVTVVEDPPGAPLRATRDPGDDFVIALALHHNVDIIVSGDKDLLVLDPIGDIRVVPPAVFMEFIESSTP